MALPWSWIFILHALLVRPGYANVHERQNGGVLPREIKDGYQATLLKASSPVQKRNIAPIVVGVVAGVALVIGLIILVLCLRKRRRLVTQVEDGVPEKSPHWWMVDQRAEKVMDWWKLDHDIPPRVDVEKEKETKPSHLDRLRSALGRRGGSRGQAQVSPPLPIQFPPATPSPTESIELPQPSVRPHMPRYPSILERGSRAFSPSPKRRSFNRSPPYAGEESRPKRKFRVPPRALIVPPPGRSVPGLADRKTGTPRSANQKRRDWLTTHQPKHPFLPLKDSDAPFPPISAPIPSTLVRTTHTNTAYADQEGSRLEAPLPPLPPTRPRIERKHSRRIPVPEYQDHRRPLMPIPPHMRNEIGRAVANDARRMQISQTTPPPGQTQYHRPQYPQPI
ncbi:hypothetical protein BDQ12DRAFT_661910 [Crucibulum laeve]|uniref:Uncharacterized protein n=1 Tax=Crucibulum laeve TaxID=68775 RepID=A0A5C3MFJ6_9AGAR|nr:hypothetical protein BDQ12DRAFT_661910 [Crucibulum laeve]